MRAGSSSRPERDSLDEFDADSPSAARPRTAADSGSPDASAPEIRRDRAVAAVASLAFGAALAAVAISLKNGWAGFDAARRVGIVCAILAALHLGAGVARRLNSVCVSRIALLYASIVFGVGIFLLDPSAPDVDGAADCRRWTLGVLPLATVANSISLHFCAATALVCALALDFRPETALAGFLVCALGEFWAATKDRKSVGATYFAIGVAVALGTVGFAASAFFSARETSAAPGAWARPDLAAPFGFAVGLFAYWFGVALKNAGVRGVGIFLVSTSLAVATFPQYWSTLGGIDSVEPVVSLGGVRLDAARVCANAATLLFGLCVGYLTLDGARRSAFRFGFGIVLFLAWLGGRAATAANGTSGATGAAVALGLVAATAFLFLYAERRARLRRAKLGKRARIVRSNATTDALDDDPEFDDACDAEARETAEAPRSLALVAEWDELCGRIAPTARCVGFAVALALQYALLPLVAFGR